MPSVIMTVTGSEELDEFVVIGVHIDSTARGGNADNTPSADDSASGIATITEVARVLFAMNFKPKRTIEFMAFAAEEVGLRGSKEIAEDYRSRNVNVVSYVQFDMTNYKGSSKDVYISTDSYNDDNLNNFLVQLMDFYNASGTHRIQYGTSQCNYGCSDHYSWAQQGYDVSFPFEATFNQSNPNIHTTRDTFDRSPTPNATHAAKFAKLALEYMIEVSNGISGGGDGNPCDGVAAYDSSQTYTNGDRVTFQGSLYERNTTGWTNLGTCESPNPETPEDICKAVSAYDSTQRYSPGDQVTFRGSLYERTTDNRWNRVGACGDASRIAELGALADDDNVMVFAPNPVQGDIVDVTINNDLWQGNNILIIDAKGSIPKEVRLTEEVTRINVSDLATGMYFLTFQNGPGTITKQLIKQ